MIALYSLTKEGASTFWWADKDHLSHLVVSRYYIKLNHFKREQIMDMRVIEDLQKRRMLHLQFKLMALSFTTVSTDSVADFDRYYEEIATLLKQSGPSGPVYRIDLNTSIFWLSVISSVILWLVFFTILIRRRQA